ncbi:pyridoxamine 5'-phosphate oxidase family protein [Petropleomorpha daqingensis]|uniref:PPOX class probable F420-dependent enzyme n=1 Tax=Petropleomorpha daqingensis TaxID=2026353 RepID=A0A853CAQ5_9ACTN|nr:PPOX class probable F420-dependent enzyme [Petropleomorpha daqingensis]
MGPVADRPVMPGYGILPAGEGTGLLPWAEAERRLTVSHDYWCATVSPDGRPHIMPVWGIWDHGRLWFSSGLRSRKARNLAADPRCTLTTDNARDPVVLEGRAEVVTEADRIAAFVDAVNAKYGAGLTPDFQDPAVNGTFAVTPGRVFALSGADFAGSPTRWTFG